MQVTQIVEALLFASPEPLTTKAIARIIRNVSRREAVHEKLQQVSVSDVTTAITELADYYEKEEAPFAVEERASGWKLYSRAEYGEYVRELFPGKKAPRLSPPALETLAIVSYRQPLTKAAIEAVRGVAVDGVLHTLIERGLVRIGGRADLPGRPMLYETTDSFLDYFGIKTVDDLPNAIELRQVPLPQPEEELVAPSEEQLPLSGIENQESEESVEPDPEEGVEAEPDDSDFADSDSDSVEPEATERDSPEPEPVDVN